MACSCWPGSNPSDKSKLKLIYKMAAVGETSRQITDLMDARDLQCNFWPKWVIGGRCMKNPWLPLPTRVLPSCANMTKTSYIKRERSFPIYLSMCFPWKKRVNLFKQPSTRTTWATEPRRNEENSGFRTPYAHNAQNDRKAQGTQVSPWTQTWAWLSAANPH